MEDCKLSLISHPAHIRQSSFDVLKCVAAFLVVAIHYGPYWINPISRIAVPLFFMITGYYFVTFSAISKFRKHFRKILIMTISASLFYRFLSFSSAIYFGTFDNWFDSKFNLKTIAVYTLFDLDLFQIHLWYFYALAYDLLIIYFLTRKKKTHYLYYAIPLLLLAFFLLRYLRYPNCYYRNWLFEGLPCISIGMLIREYEEKIKSLFTDTQLIVFTLFSLMLCSFEFLSHKFIWGGEIVSEIYIFSIPMSVCLICLAVKNPSIGENTIAVKIGSVYSPSIYILHIFVGQYLLVSNLDDYPLFKTGIIFLESLLLSIFYIYLKKLIKSIYETNSNH